MLGSVVGSYRIVQQIGQGGMGRVYLAEHTLLGKRAAVKVLLPQYSANAQVVNRFFNEARASSMLKHPGVIDVYDFGRLPDNRAFLVMELLDGESLSALIARERRLPLERVVDIARQVANALTAAHERGIVHRDLKPDNIFLVEDADLRSGVRAKVLDFGVAKLMDDTAATGITRTGALIGTPTYMSPEQCRGAGDVDHRADVYALGCVMFEMASGVPPFVGDGMGDVIAGHLFQDPAPLTGVLPPPIDRVVARMLAKLPQDRFQTMREVAAQLAQPIASSPSRLEIPTLRVPTVPTGSATSPARTPIRTELHPNATVYRSSTTLAAAAGEVTEAGSAPRRARPTVLVAAAVLSVVAATALVVARRSGGPRAVPPLPQSVAAASLSQPAEPLPPARETTPPARETTPPARETTPTAPEAITVTIGSRPEGADVYRMADGVRLGKTPWTTRYAVSPGEAVFRLRLRGYRDAELAVRLDQDSTHVAVLEKIAHSTTRAVAVRPDPVELPLRSKERGSETKPQDIKDASKQRGTDTKLQDLKDPFVD
jgi:eukaryotic-like serine/threonine-protein kinase